MSPQATTINKTLKENFILILPENKYNITLEDNMLTILAKWNMALINYAASNPQALIITIILIYTLAFIHIYLIKPSLTHIILIIKNDKKKPNKKATISEEFLKRLEYTIKFSKVKAKKQNQSFMADKQQNQS